MFWLVSGGLMLASSALESGGAIPKAHTCQGADRAVPLHGSGVPEGTKSFALVALHGHVLAEASLSDTSVKE